jgi:hypothetical protein
MYTYIAIDKQGNSFTSKQCFESEEEAYESAMTLAKYDFIVQFDILKCEDIICYQLKNIMS